MKKGDEEPFTPHFTNKDAMATDHGDRHCFGPKRLEILVFAHGD